MIKVGIGQDSHRISETEKMRPFLLGGVIIPAEYSLEGNSDADVILHALTNGVSGITGNPILGEMADNLLKDGYADSRVYLKRALEDLQKMQFKVSHVSVSVECKKPKLADHMAAIRATLAELLEITIHDVGITATTGEGLTDFGKGLGVQAICIVTAVHV